MPFGIHKHSNRSRQALPLTDPAATPATGTATPSSSGESEADPTFTSEAEARSTTQQHPVNFQQQNQQQLFSHPSPAVSDIDHRPHPQTGELPSRSQSTRFPSAGAYQQQQQQLLQAQAADDLALETRKGQVLHQERAAPAQSPVAEHKKSKSIFDRMRSSSSRTQEQKPAPNPSSYNNTGPLARRLSRRQENPPALRTRPQRPASDQYTADWQAAQDSRTYLPSPQERIQDDEDLDPYLIRPDHNEPLGASHSAPHSAVQEYSQHQTIRPVQQDDLELYLDEGRQQFPPQQAHSPIQIHHQSDIRASNHLELQNQGGFHQQLGVQPATLATIDPYRQQNPETVSQLSYESPIEQREEQQRPISVHSNGPSGQSPISYSAQRQEQPNHTSSVQGPRPAQYTSMAPPVGASQQNRRLPDSKSTMQPSQALPEPRDGPNFTRQQYPASQTPTASISQIPQAPNYRGGPPQREQFGPAGGEQGRSTPPPAPVDRDVNEAYKELLTKYKKVKGLYFDKTAQVEQLQNTLANQRLSQSRTSLDDSEYISRFQRLDGAITNLAFNIRKDWRSITPWLAQYVNQDAVKIGKQEMTAVGRACITKFIMDEIFTRTFHPGLEPELSQNLKTIEQNIRRFSPALNNQEESDALISKVVNWRLATLEGLREVLSTPESEEYKREFSRVCTTNLTASLINLLQEPIPAGIEDSAHMIIELAVSIAANMPLESRDINIVYPMPGDLLQPYIMKAETGIPPLENPGAESSEADASSTASGEKEEPSKESEKGDGKTRKKETKHGMLSAMMGGSSSGQTNKKAIPQDTTSEGKSKVPIEDGPQKVRLAGFVGIEVRGRQMLGKAPVWTVS